MENNFPKIPLILSAIFFIFFCSAFVFLYREINDNNQKAEQGTIVWQTEAHQRDEIKSLNRSIQMIAGDRALLETHFAKSSDIVPFLDTIEKLAPEAGAKAEVDSVNVPADNTGLTVGLKVSGSFGAIYKFLTLLENSPYELDFLLIDIHKLTVPNMPGKNIQDSKWEAVFKIQLLSFIP
jgi:hypothetical protein